MPERNKELGGVLACQTNDIKKTISPDWIIVFSRKVINKKKKYLMLCM